ncbi:hypothetical protein BFP97_12630 [Roseivirga sp. 4D4]|uniref:hypothetical protein n=1 Tax=Roseivirga sp. 4D4 TaxID=1889784 RepID=UPI0008533EF1|nr:hypothetical protein [Roseivirga sp. 4D4]OEK02311.1 hypothetical protein BFP97_12630 [Roseivirga sp. 4D4]
MIDTEETAKKKLLSTSRAIIANQVALPVGILSMNKLMSIFSNEIQELGLSLSTFKTAYNEIYEFALGSERINCNVHFLIKQDKELNATLDSYRDSILIECFDLVRILSSEDK